MQTFLPYKHFSETARVLDMRRLGKQRVETFQILNALTGKSKGNGWKNHPAVKMWRGYEVALAHYGIAICNEWIGRGYKDTMLSRFQSFINENVPAANHNLPYSYTMPPWWGDESFHRSHKSNLIRKLPDHYKTFWPKIPDDLPYVWPI